MSNQHGRRFLLDPNIEQTMREETFNASSISMERQGLKYKGI